MVSQLSQSNRAIATDEWVEMSWDDFVNLIEQPDYQECRAYYHNQKMRIETMPIGSDHAQEHGLLIFMIGLYAMLQGIKLVPKDNCTFRKPGVSECQPDLAYYIGEQANSIPRGTRIIDLDQYPLPDIVIEVADTTFADDIGEKRLQYEDLRIPEYWVWNVQTGKIIAFAHAADGSSRQIRVSVALPGLELDLLEAAIERSWQSDQSAAGQWLMQQWQG